MNKKNKIALSVLGGGALLLAGCSDANENGTPVEVNGGFIVPQGSEVNPSRDSIGDFTDPYVVEVVTPEGEKFFYTLEEAEQVDLANYLNFAFPNQLQEPMVQVVDQNKANVLVLVPEDMDLTSVVPTITTPEGVILTPARDMPQDFTSPVTYTVDPLGASVYEYEVTVVPVAPFGEAEDMTDEDGMDDADDMTDEDGMDDADDMTDKDGMDDADDMTDEDGMDDADDMTDEDGMDDADDMTDEDGMDDADDMTDEDGMDDADDMTDEDGMDDADDMTDEDGMDDADDMTDEDGMDDADDTMGVDPSEAGLGDGEIADVFEVTDGYEGDTNIELIYEDGVEDTDGGLVEDGVEDMDDADDMTDEDMDDADDMTDEDMDDADDMTDEDMDDADDMTDEDMDDADDMTATDDMADEDAMADEDTLGTIYEVTDGYEGDTNIDLIYEDGVEATEGGLVEEGADDMTDEDMTDADDMTDEDMDDADDMTDEDMDDADDMTDEDMDDADVDTVYEATEGYEGEENIDLIYEDGEEAMEESSERPLEDYETLTPMVPVVDSEEKVAEEATEATEATDTTESSERPLDKYETLTPMVPVVEPEEDDSLGTIVEVTEGYEGVADIDILYEDGDDADMEGGMMEEGEEVDIVPSELTRPTPRPGKTDNADMGDDSSSEAVAPATTDETSVVEPIVTVESETINTSAGPAGSDSDIDGVSDLAERLFGRDPLTHDNYLGSKIEFFNDNGFTDADADGIDDDLEAALGTNSRKVDTDGDGYGDLNEVMNGTDPLDGMNP